MAIPSNVSAALNAADQAIADLEAKQATAAQADTALTAAQAAADASKSAVESSTAALATAKSQLDAAVADWLTVPAPSAPAQPSVETGGTTVVSPDAKPGAAS